MPLSQRIVEPIDLGRQAVEEEYKFDLDIISNRKLIGALHQLGSLMGHADQIFSELTDECQKVITRTVRLNQRIRRAGDVTKTLNAKTCRVRE